MNAKHSPPSRISVRGKISVGDAIDTAHGIGIVKAVERVKLGRFSGLTDRYQVTDGDYKWEVNKRDVIAICMRGAAKVVDGKPINIREAIEIVNNL